MKVNLFFITVSYCVKNEYPRKIILTIFKYIYFPESKSLKIKKKVDVRFFNIRN